MTFRRLGDVAAGVVERLGDVRPIPTRWRGVTYRSRLEARWAVFFDLIEAGAEYEPEGFDLGFAWYLPDFNLRNFGLFAEIKPLVPTHDEAEKARALAAVTARNVLMLIGPPSARRGILFWPNGGIANQAGFARCRRCPALAIAYQSDPDGLECYGYLPIGACGQSATCGDRQPGIGNELDAAMGAADDERFERRHRPAAE